MNSTAGQTIGTDGWRLLSPPPSSKDAQVEIGVLSIHPSLTRVAYATRSKSANEFSNLSRSRIVLTDFDASCNSVNDGSASLLASISLKELVRKVNEFRIVSHTNTLTPCADEVVNGFDGARASSVVNLTPDGVGAVQYITFLDDEALSCTVARGHVRGRRRGRDEAEERGGLGQRLIVGFRRCFVVVTVDVSHSNNQQEQQYQPIIHVHAYVGPEDLDEYEHDAKAGKRQPSSRPAPIASNLLAYGSFDGGIRFYNISRRRQVKAVLGPSGRSNPVVRVMNANSAIRNAQQSIVEPRMISVCASGIAYLWRLDLIMEADDIVHFNVPPPLACLDGLIAAASGSGMPVRHPPPLSATSIASLGPTSTWEETDETGRQFDLAYDPKCDRLHWVFAGECLGATLLPRGSREEWAENVDAVVVCWELDGVADTEQWPPPALPPRCVIRLGNVGKSGRVTTDMTSLAVDVGGLAVEGGLVHCAYVTMASDVVLATADLGGAGEGSLRVEASDERLTDLSDSEAGYVAYALASSPNLLVVGTQFGLLWTALRANGSSRRPTSGGSSVFGDRQSILSCISEESIERDLSLLANRVRELEGANSDLQERLDVATHVVFNREESERNLRARLDEAASRLEELRNGRDGTSEQDLRDYIALLEEDRTASERELDEARIKADDAARRQAEVFGELETSLRSELREQKTAIETLVELLEHERKTHGEALEDQANKTKSAEDELAAGKAKFEKQSKDLNTRIAKLEAENRALKADAKNGNQIFIQMRLELQSALKELAEIKQGQGSMQC